VGIDCADIQRLIYNNFSENRMRLFGICLSKNLFVLPEYKTAYIVLSMNDLKKYSFQEGDTEGIVNYAMAIEGIEFAALFIERKDLIRISLRSFGKLSVNLIARTFFEGGGHKNAAGANSYNSLRKTIHTFKEILPKLSEFYID
jgi:phosphoesterase RecJ-like protein